MIVKSLVKEKKGILEYLFYDYLFRASAVVEPWIRWFKKLSTNHKAKTIISFIMSGKITNMK